MTDRNSDKIGLMVYMCGSQRITDLSECSLGLKSRAGVISQRDTHRHTDTHAQTCFMSVVRG